MPIICQLCKKEFEQIAPAHLKYKHNGITMTEYQEMFPNALIKSLEVTQKISQSMKETCSSPEYRQGMSERAKQLWEDSEYHQRQCNASKRMWENPEYNAKQKALRADPEFKQNISNIITELWEDEEYANRTILGIRHAHAKPSYRQLCVKLSQEQWADPEARKLASEQAIERWKNPDYRRQQSESRKGSIPWNKGKTGIYSNETKQIMSKKRIEYFETHEHPKGMLGKTHTEETCQQISGTLKTVWEDPELRSWRRNLSLEMWQDPEFHEKMVDIHQARWANPEWASQQIRKMNSAQHIRPTQPELELAQLLEDNGYSDYEYTGDRSLWIDRRNPDFTWSEENKIIEMFGSYWHDESEIKPRTEHFAEHGYDTLIVWDYELDDTETLLTKLEKFHQD